MNRPFTVGGSLVALMLIAAEPARAVEPGANAPTVVTVPVSATAPKLDGVIGENEWAGPVVQGFYQQNADQMDRRGGRFTLACDGTYLYVAVATPVHPRFGPVARNLSPDPDDVVLDDSLEIWLAPGLSGPAEGAYQIMFDTRGGYSTRRFVDPAPTINFYNVGWDLKGDFARGSVIRDSWWTLETAIPLAALGTNAPGAGLRLRVCRNYKLPFVQARDNRAVVYYKDPATMMQVRFQNSVPLVDEPDWVGVKGEQAVVTLRNPTPAAMKVQLAGAAVELAPGATYEAPIPVKTGDQNVRQVEVTITGSDGTVIHRRTARWVVTDMPIWEEVL